MHKTPVAGKSGAQYSAAVPPPVNPYANPDIVKKFLVKLFPKKLQKNAAFLEKAGTQKLL
ncbi:hypothetical protein K6L44_06170 [Gluconacetobacter entanii]|uniref:hypothetical protein n=1 Tax=Gluconacetobacter entanii TaxID=108528 RepID=UPI001C93225F|nr:hypothetical protein [Gluconacetobacter entanii]MBY4639586.1 hypothetical protein [Gluconacetobacter entanii]MCW4580035.1 hypothetical protein [Gluconacetobacter entanii]MCW4583422.1 hypothetical protein [Gluconacetobacter entanii]MCW4586768.1 hypothetical protein [Gluconacetobacter entanii]